MLHKRRGDIIAALYMQITAKGLRKICYDGKSMPQQIIAPAELHWNSQSLQRFTTACNFFLSLTMVEKKSNQIKSSSLIGHFMRQVQTQCA